MRKFLITLAVTGSALAFASPAAAQYYPAPVPQGYAYGYNNFGQVRALQARLERIDRQIRQLDRRNVIRDRSADRLREDVDNVERRLRRASRYGLNPYEMNDVQVRIARLEQRVQFAAANRYGRNGYSNYSDRDRDGRNDRYEDDRGYRRDR